MQEVINKDGLFVKVKDWDRGLKNDDLGSVQISAKTLIQGTGEVIEFKLNPPHGKEEKDAVSLFSCFDNQNEWLLFLSEILTVNEEGILILDFVC